MILNKNIYSLVLSDEVVEAVDRLAHAAGISRSAMINQILAERVAYITPEMRLNNVMTALQDAMNEGFSFFEQPSVGTLSCRTALKYRYKPTVRYSVELNTRGGRKTGELKVSFRTQNAQLISDLTGFFRCWAALEQHYISSRLSQDISYTIENGRFTRALALPYGSTSDELLGAVVADYMAMFDGAMKQYFALLPDTGAAAAAAERSYTADLAKQRTII